MIWAWFINNILFLTRLLVPRHSLVPRPSRVGGRNMEMPPVRPSIPPSFRPSVCPHLSCERDNLRRQSCRVHLLKISDEFKFQRPYFRDILGIMATRGRGTLNSIWLVTTGLNWVVNLVQPTSWGWKALTVWSFYPCSGWPWWGVARAWVGESTDELCLAS